MSLRCPDNDVSLEQKGTGKIVGGKQEWKLTLRTGCFCPQINVTIACNGFESFQIPDPSTFVIKDSTCLILRPVTLLDPVNIFYVADTDFGFYLLASTAKC